MKYAKVLFVYADLWNRVHLQEWRIPTVPLTTPRDRNVSDLIHAMRGQDFQEHFEKMLEHYKLIERDILGNCEQKLLHVIAFDGKIGVVTKRR